MEESLSGFDTNKITMMFLAKQTYNENIKQMKTERAKQYKKDVKFYKKRIYDMMKKLMHNEYPNERIKALHEEYVNAIIHHLKTEDRTDILQKEYIEQNNDISLNDIPDFTDIPNMSMNATIDEANECMMKKKIEPIATLDNFVNVKRVTVEQPEFPKRKNINIKTKEHRIKGIKNDKSKNDKNKIVKDNKT